MPDLQRVVRFLTKRDTIRTAFLVFFVYLMVQLWRFAQWALGNGSFVERPEAVAGLIPIGAWMSFFAWIKTGIWDIVVPAGLVIIIASLMLSFLLKRGFCGWICPVGAFFQLFVNLGDRLRRGKKLPVWRPLDLTLRGLRYAITAVLVWFLAAGIPVDQAIGFRQLPYYAAADVKILSYFVHPHLWWLLLGGFFIGTSTLWGNVWCRWVCPLGGVYGALGSASMTNVVRDGETCISCGKCAKVCPNRVPVDALHIVRAPECDGCQTCVTSCPKPGALEAKALGTFTMPKWVWPVAAVGLWLAIYLIALGTGHWRSGAPLDYLQAAVQQVLTTPPGAP